MRIVLALAWRSIAFVGATLEFAAHIGVENRLVVRRQRGRLVLFQFANAEQCADQKRL